MTLYSSILVAHILGAVGTGLCGATALYLLAQNRAHLFSFSALTLAMFGVFQTLSGALLALVSPSVTALSLCDNLALYIVPLIALELLLALRMRHFGVTVPSRVTFTPIAGSVAVFCALVVVGV